MLTVQGLIREFADPRPERVLRGVDLEVPAGSSVAIMGPSGSGKSTLLAILGGLDRPTAGRVELDGRCLHDLHDRELTRARARTIGFVFQDHHLLPHCTAMENALLPCLALGRTTAESHSRAAELLQRVGLGDRGDHFPAQLSAGQRQRVALVRALINRPRLLLADEPTGALDHATSRDLADLLLEVNREQGVTLVVATHSRDLAMGMGRPLELRDGVLREPPG